MPPGAIAAAPLKRDKTWDGLQGPDASVQRTRSSVCAMRSRISRVESVEPLSAIVNWSIPIPLRRWPTAVAKMFCLFRTIMIAATLVIVAKELVGLLLERSGFGERRLKQGRIR